MKLKDHFRTFTAKGDITHACDVALTKDQRVYQIPCEDNLRGAVSRLLLEEPVIGMALNSCADGDACHVFLKCELLGDHIDE